MNSGEAASGPIVAVGSTEWGGRVAEVLPHRETKSWNGTTLETEDVDSWVGAVIRADDSWDGDWYRNVRDVSASLPVVAVVDSLSHPIVSAAATDGQTTILSSTDLDRLDAVLTAMIGNRRAGHTSEELDGLFDVAFDDDRLRWILDASGRILETNRTAAAAIGRTQQSLRGERWWDGPWWTGGDTQEIKACVHRIDDEGEVRVETTAIVKQGERATVEVTVSEATSDRLLATAIDVSERTELAERLHRSEELHRVTLNNMTDTVLLTDDDGRFTYICPNVHFIFGYTVAEIEEMGTIDELLGPDLFDSEELRERGVMTNVECTTTDKAGEEHTLLVNVKEVSIQEGTTLYSCRDVTKRKQRERALSALHQTARDLSYAETGHEIAEVVVTDATDVLPNRAVALYRYDSDDNVLRPETLSAEMDQRYGPLHPIDTGANGLGRAFLEGEPVADVPVGSDVDGGRALCLPVGDHGVLVVATEEPIDEITREVAELVAATAEAAFDRVTREAALRERDRRLSEQNRQLERTNRINDLIREVDRAIVRAETREEIEHAVCERLVDADRFTFAWIGEHAAGGNLVQPRAWDGAGRGYLDRAFGEGVDPQEPSVRAASTGSPCAVVNIARAPRAAPWRKAALSSGFQSVVSVPLLADDATHGTLSVYATRPDAIDDVTRNVLAEFGRTVGSAISAIARKEALLGNSQTELEYRSPTPDDVLGRLVEELDCSLELDGVIHSGDTVTAYLTVGNASPEEFATLASEYASVDEARALVETEDGGTVQLRMHPPFVASSLADHGATILELTADEAGLRLVVSVSPPVATRTIHDVVSDHYPDSTLVAQRERSRSIGGDSSALVDRLTERQVEVLQTAYYTGYFSSPRESIGEDVAEILGISPQAFYKHVRSAQAKLFSEVFEGTVD